MKKLAINAFARIVNKLNIAECFGFVLQMNAIKEEEMDY
jgi:hypothetical protein